MCWLTLDLPQGVVVVPAEDIIEHTRTSMCVCYPEVEECASTTIMDDEPRMATRKLIIHKAMDGRDK